MSSPRGCWRSIDYFLDRTNSGLQVNGKNFSCRPGYADLIGAIGGCTALPSADGSTTARCAGGTSVFAGTGDGCEDLVNQRPNNRCHGVRNIVRVRVGRDSGALGARAVVALTEPPVLVPGKSLGPFAIGQSYQAVSQLGFRMRNVDRGRPMVCVATNQSDDLCTYDLQFIDNRLRLIQYKVDVAAVGFKFAGRRVPQSISFDALEKTPGCTPGEPAEGGTTSNCGPGIGVSLGTGGRCGDQVSISSKVHCGPGPHTATSVIVFGP